MHTWVVWTAMDSIVTSYRMCLTCGYTEYLENGSEETGRWQRVEGSESPWLPRCPTVPPLDPKEAGYTQPTP